MIVYKGAYYLERFIVLEGYCLEELIVFGCSCFWMFLFLDGYYLEGFIVLDGFYVIYWHILCRKVKNRVIVYEALSRRMTGQSRT